MERVYADVVQVQANQLAARFGAGLAPATLLQILTLDVIVLFYYALMVFCEQLGYAQPQTQT